MKTVAIWTVWLTILFGMFATAQTVQTANESECPEDSDCYFQPIND